MILYDLFLLGYVLVSLPRALRKGASLKRLGFSLPQKEADVWIQSVSVGETKAASTLLPHMQGLSISASTTTETGFAEAQRSLPGMDEYFLLPIDFSWNMRRLVKRLRPKLLILVENSFWYHLLFYAKKGGASVVLVNGRLSLRSFRRLKQFPFVARALFSRIDFLCVQDEEYRARFLSLGVPEEKIAVTGNIKFDIAAQPKRVWNFPESAFVVTLASTHGDEEKLLIAALRAQQIPGLKILVAPRHPNRFSEVEKLCNGKLSQLRGDEDVILVDAMGILSSCYAQSHVAVVGGSFVQGIGGHDIFEPVRNGAVPFFGPFMENQQQMTHLILGADVGFQGDISAVVCEISRLAADRAALSEKKKRGEALTQKVIGSSLRTWNTVKTFAHKESVC